MNYRNTDFVVKLFIVDFGDPSVGMPSSSEGFKATFENALTLEQLEIFKKLVATFFDSCSMVYDEFDIIIENMGDCQQALSYYEMIEDKGGIEKCHQELSVLKQEYEAAKARFAK